MAGSAIWTTLRDWLTNEIINAAELNAQLRDNLTYLGDLAYVEFTSNVSVTAATEAAPTDVISSGAIVYAATPIEIEFFAPRISPGAGSGDWMVVSLWDDTTNLGQFAQVQTPAANVLAVPCSLKRKITPIAGSHTYKVRAFKSGGNGTIYAGPGGAGGGIWLPGFIRVKGVPS